MGVVLLSVVFDLHAGRLKHLEYSADLGGRERRRELALYFGHHLAKRDEPARVPLVEDICPSPKGLGVDSVCPSISFARSKGGHLASDPTFRQ